VPNHVSVRVQRRQVWIGDGPLGVGHRFEHLIFDGDAFRRPARGLRVVCRHDGHRLALVPHDVDREHRLVRVLEPEGIAAGHVGLGQHGVHAGHRQRRPHVDRPDPRVRVRAAQRRAPQHVLGPQVR
jgi:hypothetical protein